MTLRRKLSPPRKDTPWRPWWRRYLLKRRLPTLVAQPTTFTTSTHLSRSGAIVSYEVADQSVLAGATESTEVITYVDGGGYGGFRAISIAIEHSASSNSAFFVFATFATERGVVSTHISTIWTGLTAPAAARTDMFYYSKEDTQFDSVGTHTPMSAVLTAPFFALGIEVTGGQTVTYNLLVMLEID